MTEDEADGLLRSLNGMLAELGAIVLGDQARRAALEQGEEPDSRAELALLLDELESVLVDAPRMFKATLGMLGAERITFMTDKSDVRFHRPDREPIESTDDDVSISMDTLGPLLRNAERASAIIGELRQRLYE